jgi:hypothetical protein
MFQLCFNFNRTHDSVGKTLRTANQARVTVNSHALSFRDCIFTFFAGNHLQSGAGLRARSL